jgi:RNA polymerase sigma-70 factor (ECF subfamily)
VEALALAGCGRDDLRRELGRLSGREREALAMRFGAELPSAEIGAVLGISAPAARMLVHRAVTKLREVLPDA